MIFHIYIYSFKNWKVKQSNKYTWKIRFQKSLVIFISLVHEMRREKIYQYLYCLNCCLGKIYIRRHVTKQQRRVLSLFLFQNHHCFCYKTFHCYLNIFGWNTNRFRSGYRVFFLNWTSLYLLASHQSTSEHIYHISAIYTAIYTDHKPLKRTDVNVAL